MVCTIKPQTPVRDCLIVWGTSHKAQSTDPVSNPFEHLWDTWDPLKEQKIQSSSTLDYFAGADDEWPLTSLSSMMGPLMLLLFVLLLLLIPRTTVYLNVEIREFIFMFSTMKYTIIAKVEINNCLKEIKKKPHQCHCRITNNGNWWFIRLYSDTNQCILHLTFPFIKANKYLTRTFSNVARISKAHIFYIAKMDRMKSYATDSTTFIFSETFG